MRHYPRSSACREDSILDVSIEDIPKIVTKIAQSAREHGVKVTLSEEVDGATLLLNYVALRGKLTLSDVAFVLSSVFAKRENDREILRRIIADMFCSTARKTLFLDNVVNDLRKLGTSFGRRLDKPLGRMSQHQREAYARLRILGFIRRGRKGFYVLTRSKAERQAKMLSKKYGDYNNAIKSLILGSKQALTIASIMRESLFHYVNLDELSISKAIELYRVMRGGYERKVIAKAIAEKLEENKNIDPKDAQSILEILVRHRLLTSKHAARLMRLDPRLATQLSKIYGKEFVLDVASSVAQDDQDVAAQITAYGLGFRGSDREAFKTAFKMGKKAISGREIEKYRRIANIEYALIKYFETGNEAYLDILQAELEKTMSRYSEDEDIKSLTTSVKAILEGDLHVFIKSKVFNLDVYTLFSILHRIYTSSVDRRLRMQALYLMQLLWYKAVKGRHGRARKRYVNVLDNIGVMVNSRESIYNLIRMITPFIIWRRPVRSRQFVLVLDKSASMRQFAFYALLSAASLSPYVKRLVLFDSDVVVIDRLDRHIRKPRRVLDLIMSTRFEGYTNISKALEEAVKGLSPQTLVLVSDLKQTVITDVSPEDIISNNARRGWMIHIITSSRVDSDLYSSLVMEPRVKIYVVERLNDLVNTLRRIVSR